MLSLEEAAVLLGAVLVRACVALHGYSGESRPPMYGDYEAQRHWMELTLALPPRSWYVDGPDNDLQYWGLDYPPVSAYLSWLVGYMARVCGHPELVALHTSRGHESEPTRVFMRRSVLACDALVYLPAAVAAARAAGPPGSPRRLDMLVLLTALPALLLVDHGHFQYNCVSLGFALWAALAAMAGRPLACCAAFSLSLNTKQMGLYLAPAFFCYLLAAALRRPTQAARLRSLASLGTVTLGTFALCWAPFLRDGDWLPVLSRVFPTSRHLYEDKVANLWCTLALLPPLKLKALLSIPTLVALAATCTLAALLPPCALLMRRPSRAAFLLCATACALAFFLLSYQVHEKHILLVLLPASLLAPRSPPLFVWLASVATFSMFPLLARDGLRLPYAVTQVAYLAYGLGYLGHFAPPRPSLPRALRIPLAASLLGMATLHVAEVFVPPPSRYPDIHAVAFCAFACAHFVGAYAGCVGMLVAIAETEPAHAPLDYAQLQARTTRRASSARSDLLEYFLDGGPPPTTEATTADSVSERHPGAQAPVGARRTRRAKSSKTE